LEGWGNGSEYGVVPLFVEALEKFELQLSNSLPHIGVIHKVCPKLALLGPLVLPNG